MFGHPLGNATAASAMAAGTPITAGANLDGSLFGPVVANGLRKPFLLMSEDADNKPSWPPLRMRGRRGSLEGKSQIAVQGAVGREVEARREGEVARGRQVGQPAGVGVEELEPQGQTALQDRDRSRLRRLLEPGQYVSTRYGGRLLEAGATASVGSVADSRDNAMAEALNGSFKAELIEHPGPWRDADQVEYAVAQ
ncbi:hypothetical protein ACFY1C_32730 [Streptomyces sp. NPDC001279]|uniref:hypothetical protein n=1 Tax=Streptomyces sp. NPDC001279 TaxID=3364556 RepID=UPI00367F47C6